MERFQCRRSHGRRKPSHGCAADIRNVSGQKSGANFVRTERVYGEGNRQNRELIYTLKDRSDSSSCSSGPTDEDSVSFELRRSSLKQACGTPIKKLLAEEMSKEMESRRRPPSVIARLMGLDVLPPQQPAHKQQKRFSQNYLQRTASIALQEKSSTYESRSFRMSIKEKQEFKDVFEVSVASEAEKQCDPSVLKGTANSKASDAKMAFIRQKFMDAKRLSTNEKLQHSKEFDDALEVLDSNKDLLLKFLEEPDSLFTKHLHDLHGIAPPRRSGEITVLKTSNAPKYEKSDICCKSEQKAEQREVMNTFQKHDSGHVGHCHSRHGSNNSYKLSKSRNEEKDETCPLPTKIVVLKPNLSKAQNVARSVSSPCSSAESQSGCRKHGEFQSFDNRELFSEVRDWKNSSNDVEFMRHRYRSSREFAKEVTRQMRHSVSRSSVRLFSSGLRGYAGDESSNSMSENDSANESDAVAPTSRHVLDWKNRYSPSSSYSTESSVNREAKKRLSERWKMTHRFQEVGLVGSASTLAEMLAMPDRETRPTISDSNDRLARTNGVARCGSPLGISSKDGWKDGSSRNLPRSKSVPASSTAFGSPESSIRHVAFGDDRCLMLKEGINEGLNGSRKGNSNHKEDSILKNLRSRSKKSQSSLDTDGEYNHSVQEAHFSLDKLRNNLEENNQAGRKPMASEPLACDVADKRLVEVAVAETDNVARSSVIPEEQLPEPTVCITLVNDGGSSAHYPDSIAKEAPNGSPEKRALSSNCSVPEPGSPASSKEASQPSPVSVLEPPFVEDMSSGSECFERVSADLHGLRMQLQLLKLESSDAYTDELGMIVSSDEDGGEGSISHLEEAEPMGMFRAEESRDFSYLVDVLVESGFHSVDPEIVLEAWYTSECPVGPMVFEKLEKKYGEQLTWPRSERKLLFDLVSCGLMEFFQPMMDPHPWVKPVTKKVATRYCKEALAEELWKLLDSERKEASSDSSEKVLGREMRWLELEDDTDVVGREIEKLLLDELIAEVVSM